MNNLNITKLSVLLRAAEAYAQDNVSDISELAQKLYPNGDYPFVLSDEYPLPLHLFSPRLSMMLTRIEDELESKAMWDLITKRDNIIRMVTATELERTAAESLGKQFEAKYDKDSRELRMRRKQTIGYMIKVVMECFGYLVFSSRMQVSTRRSDIDDQRKRKSNYFTTASRYALYNQNDIKVLSAKITDKQIRTTFESIATMILKGESEYQKAYNIQGLTNSKSL